MRPPTPPAQLDAVVAIVRRHPGGIAVDKIHQSLKPLPPRRSLQRWIALLVQQGRMVPVGAGRGRRYVVGDRVLPSSADGNHRRTTVSTLPREPTSAFV